MTWQLIGNIKGRDGQDATPVDISVVVAEAASKIPIPKDGKDVSVDTVREMVSTEVAKAVAAIPPAKDGLNGKDAEPIHPDTLSLMVVTEVAKAVAAIPKAKDGDPGRDAIQVEILPDIDKTRSYPRGTYAEYAGGEIRATRNTDPITDGLEKAGWAISKDGLADVVEVPSEDPRNILVEFVRTSGKKTVIERHVPFSIFKGVWHEGGDYVRGDTVQCGGNQWHCRVDGTKLEPDARNASDWTLGVRKGGKGKDIEPESLRAMIEIEVAKAVARLPKPRDGRDLTQMGPDGRKW